MCCTCTGKSAAQHCACCIRYIYIAARLIKWTRTILLLPPPSIAIIIVIDVDDDDDDQINNIFFWCIHSYHVNGCQYNLAVNYYSLRQIADDRIYHNAFRVVCCVQHRQMYIFVWQYVCSDRWFLQSNKTLLFLLFIVHCSISAFTVSRYTKWNGS